MNSQEAPKTIISIQTGQTKKYDYAEVASNRTWTSAIDKTPISETIHVNFLGLDGDEQANKKHHGGYDKAILVYPNEHYESWKKEFPDELWVPGNFGENLTVTGMNEYSVCIGDIFQIGDVILQVSEPRQPCHKLARFLRNDNLPEIIHQNNRSGWYLRVLQEGTIQAGETIYLIERKYPEWTVAYVAYIIRHVGDDFDRAERLYSCEALGFHLRNFLRDAIDKYGLKKKGRGFKQRIGSLFDMDSS